MNWSEILLQYEQSQGLQYWEHGEEREFEMNGAWS